MSSSADRNHFTQWDLVIARCQRIYRERLIDQAVRNCGGATLATFYPWLWIKQVVAEGDGSRPPSVVRAIRDEFKRLAA